MTNLDPVGSLELGAAMARASWEAAWRSGAQASVAMAEISKEWLKAYQEQLQHSAASARSIWEIALRTQHEMGGLGQRVLVANARALGASLQGVAQAMGEGAERSMPEPTQTAEAGVRRREKAA